MNQQNNTKRYYLKVKRFFDFVVAWIASALLLIPMSVIAILIMLRDPGNPFYVQERVGEQGKKIKVIKFRTMYKDADKLNKYFDSSELENYKKEYKLENDPRLLGYKSLKKYSFGKILRITSLDELPQILYNIAIKGNMSFVGPRPILVEELEANYTKEEQVLFLSAKPGLTGYWQAYARNNATYATGQRQKMELYYVQNAGFWLDIKIFFATFYTVFRMTGAN